MGKIIDKIKEKYSLLHFVIACAIVNVGTFVIFVLMHQTHSLADVIVWAPVSWAGIFVLMVFFTEFQNLGGEKEDE